MDLSTIFCPKLLFGTDADERSKIIFIWTENKQGEFPLDVTALQRLAFIVLLMSVIFKVVFESPIFYIILTICPGT